MASKHSLWSLCVVRPRLFGSQIGIITSLQASNPPEKRHDCKFGQESTELYSPYESVAVGYLQKITAAQNEVQIPTAEIVTIS